MRTKVQAEDEPVQISTHASYLDADIVENAQ
jgi:hypothetical protein